MATDKIQEAKKTLTQTLNEITFKNEQAQKIKAVQEGRERLKDSLGRNRKPIVASAPKISGLQTLNTSLGNQFKVQQ